MRDSTTDLDGATNILLEEPPMPHGRDFCTELLLAGASEPDVLFVSYTRQAADCVAQVADEPVGNVGVITVGDGSATLDDDDVWTERVSTASDLTGLGIKIDEVLGTWDGPVHVCFDSLTSMLQYVDYQMAYEFVHAVSGKINAAGARVHFHIDPNAHDDDEVAGITSLLDATITIEDDGYSVVSRKLLE
jgi:hypothetical protein